MIFNKTTSGPSCKKNIVVLALLVIFAATSLKHASAHKRNWLQTYPYWTATQGELELEQWHNASDSVADTPEEWLELEYGVTPRFMTSLYMIRDAGTLNYKGWKSENIYRLANPGEFFVDPAIYLEYRSNAPTSRPDGLEAKLILQKYFRDLQISANFAWEKKIARNGIGATPFRFDRFHVAAAYPISYPNVDAGLEFSRYVGDDITSLTPGVYANVAHDLRVLVGWEIPFQGVATSRIRTGVEWEF